MREKKPHKYFKTVIQWYYGKIILAELSRPSFQFDWCETKTNGNWQPVMCEVSCRILTCIEMVAKIRLFVFTMLVAWQRQRYIKLYDHRYHYSYHVIYFRNTSFFIYIYIKDTFYRDSSDVSVSAVVYTVYKWPG